jgi:hypothetical protein
MKRTLAILSLLSLGAFAMPSTAHAGDWGVRVGFGPRGGSVGVRYGNHGNYRNYNNYGGHRRGHHYRNRRHSYRHSYRHARHHYRSHRVWIAPAYETIVVGYDHCGEPIYRRICVRRGYWSY